MPADPEDLREVLLKIRYDATAVQAKVTDALELLGRLPLRDVKQHAHRCPECGIDKTSADALTDHLFNVHGIEEAA